jgi:hypothetical protein
VGLVVGGIGGRVVMLLIRLGSSQSVQGLESDDGFVIGQVTTETGFLLMVGAGLGGAAGVVYLVVRSALPRRGRATIFAVVAALVMGADVVKADGVDFSLLDPKPFAIAAFVLLPGIAAFAIAATVERLLVVQPWSRRRLTILLAAAALILTVVLSVVAAVAAVALVLRRLPWLGRTVLAIGRVVVPVAFVVVTLVSGLELWRDANEIL